MADSGVAVRLSLLGRAANHGGFLRPEEGRPGDLIRQAHDFRQHRDGSLHPRRAFAVQAQGPIATGRCRAPEPRSLDRGASAPPSSSTIEIGTALPGEEPGLARSVRVHGTRQRDAFP
jgi:hypothetical protein